MQSKGVIMTVSEIVKKMIDYSKGNLHDINHFMISLALFAVKNMETQMANIKKLRARF